MRKEMERMIDENRDEILKEYIEDLTIMNRYRLLVNKWK